MDWTNNKKLIIWAGVAVVVVVLAALYFGGRTRLGSQRGGVSQGPAAVPQAAQQKSATVQPVSPNTVVPGATSTVSGDVAKPAIVAQAAPGSVSNFRSFSLSVSSNEFSPSNVIAYIGDTVRLNITAKDKDYDFYQPDYGLSKQLPKGVAALVEFQVTAAGKYTFYCKSCGGPAKGPVGYVVVVPK